MDDDQTPPQDWIDALDRADADIAAGRVVPGEDVLRSLRQTLVEMRGRSQPIEARRRG